MLRQGGAWTDDLSLKQFTAVDQAADVPAYVAALEAFDGIEQLQELKALARERGGFARGRSVLDVGCGFGLETLRLARLGGPGRPSRASTRARTSSRTPAGGPRRRGWRWTSGWATRTRCRSRTRASTACGPSGC